MWTTESMLNAVGAFYNINPEKLKSGCRHKELVRARDAFVLVAKDKHLTFSEIARALNRHHTTIITAYRRATGRGQEFHKQIDFLKSMFKTTTNTVSTEYLQ